jgi:hypothetical protein
MPFMRSLPVTARMAPHRRCTAIERWYADTSAEPAGDPAGAVDAVAAVDESRAQIG